MNRPISLLSKSSQHDWSTAATSYWICNDSGSSIYITSFGVGWVCQFQESYLTKEGIFKHKDDINGFKHSLIPMHLEWEHVFETKELALEKYKEHLNKPYYGEKY